MPKNYKNKGGFSPVIGVVLMVALAVIMAAVTASFTAGVGKITRSAPTANLAVADDPRVDIANVIGNYYSLVKVSHEGGDSLKVDELEIIVTNITSGNTLRNTTTEMGVVGLARNTTINALPTSVNWLTTGNIKPGDSFYVIINWILAPDFRGEGFYGVKIIHKPTGQMIVDAQVYCH